MPSNPPRATPSAHAALTQTGYLTDTNGALHTSIVAYARTDRSEENNTLGQGAGSILYWWTYPCPTNWAQSNESPVPQRQR